MPKPMSDAKPESKPTPEPKSEPESKPEAKREPKNNAFPPAVPEIPVSNIAAALTYYQDCLGFQADWGDDTGGIAQISRGESRIFLTNPPFRSMHGNAGTVLIWFNVNSKQEVSQLHEEWTGRGAKILSAPVEKPWLLFEFTAGDPDGNLFRVFYDFRGDV